MKLILLIQLYFILYQFTASESSQKIIQTQKGPGGQKGYVLKTCSHPRRSRKQTRRPLCRLWSQRKTRTASTTCGQIR